MEQTPTLPLTAAYAFGEEKGLGPEIAGIRGMKIEWERSYDSSLRRGYIVKLFESRGLFEFKERYWPAGNTPKGETMTRRFLRIKEQYDEWLKTGDANAADEEDEVDQAFAAEAHLRDFLANNLTHIEPGLRLYQAAADQSGVEFRVDNGWIDILAVDSNDRFVVIELKVGRGRNKVLGQILYYMAWVDKKLGKAPCRGLIVAKEIPDDLMLAVQRAAGVSLARYDLSVSVKVVHSGT